MVPCDRSGHFRVSVVSYGLREEKTGSIGISLQVKLLEMLDTNTEEPEWISWAEYNMECEGTIYIIKKDKTVNQGQAEALMKYAGWDGNFDSIVNQQWQSTDFSCTVESDTYNGKTRFKIGFINDYNFVPGGNRANVDATKGKQLQSQYGSALRAIASNIKRNGVAPPASRPSAPPMPPPTRELAAAPGGDPEDIPF